MNEFLNMEHFWLNEYTRILRSGTDHETAHLEADNYLVKIFGVEAFDGYIKAMSE